MNNPVSNQVAVNRNALGKKAFPFEQLPLFSYVRPNSLPTPPRPARPVEAAGLAPAGFVRFLELARLRVQMIDNNVTAVP